MHRTNENERALRHSIDKMVELTRQKNEQQQHLMIRHIQKKDLAIIQICCIFI